MSLSFCSVDLLISERSELNWEGYSKAEEQSRRTPNTEEVFASLEQRQEKQGDRNAHLP
jgi:hypothetical protein